MLNIKAITLVTGLTSLVCQPQAWAMDKEELKGSENVGSVPIKPASEPQEAPSDFATQVQKQRLENEKLAAQLAAEKAAAEAAERETETARFKQQLEEERQKREELEEQLRAAEARKQSAMSKIEETARAPRPKSPDLPTRIGHNTKVEFSRGILAVDNFLKRGKLDWKGSKKKKK